MPACDKRVSTIAGYVTYQLERGKGDARETNRGTEKQSERAKGTHRERKRDRETERRCDRDRTTESEMGCSGSPPSSSRWHATLVTEFSATEPVVSLLWSTGNSISRKIDSFEVFQSPSSVHCSNVGHNALQSHKMVSDRAPPNTSFTNYYIQPLPCTT